MALFNSAYSALTFAYNFNGTNVVTATMGLPPAGGNGKGLGGLDGAAEAGNIQRIVKEFGEVSEALMVARFAPPRLPCSCHRPCCCGWTPNLEWKRAVRIVAEDVRYTCFNGGGDVIYRTEIASQYFLKDQERDAIEGIAARCHMPRASAYRHLKSIIAMYRGTRSKKGIEQVVLEALDVEFRNRGIVGETDE